MENEAPILGQGVFQNSSDPILSSSVAPITTGENTTDSILGAIDYPSDETTPVTETTTPPVAGTSTDTPTTTPPVTEPVTPASETVDSDNPWETLELDEAPLASQPTTAAPDVASVARLLGLESLPQTEAEQQAAIESAINARVQREVQLATHDPIRQINELLAGSDRDIVRAELNAHRTRFQTDSQIEAMLDELEGEEKLTQIATDIRTEKGTERDTIRQNQTKVLQAQAQALIDAQKALEESLQTFTDPRGRDVGAKVKGALSHYATSGQYLDDLLNQPQEWHAQMMARLHPVIGPKYREQEESLLKAKGASDVIKELEHQTVELGGGAAATNTKKIVGADDFYNN